MASKEENLRKYRLALTRAKGLTEILEKYGFEVENAADGLAVFCVECGRMIEEAHADDCMSEAARGVCLDRVVDAAREYVETIEAEVGEALTKWLATKTEKFVALKEALAKLEVKPLYKILWRHRFTGATGVWIGNYSENNVEVAIEEGKLAHPNRVFWKEL